MLGGQDVGKQGNPLKTKSSHKLKWQGLPVYAEDEETALAYIKSSQEWHDDDGFKEHYNEPIFSVVGIERVLTSEPPQTSSLDFADSTKKLMVVK